MRPSFSFIRAVSTPLSIKQQRTQPYKCPSFSFIRAVSTLRQLIPGYRLWVVVSELFLYQSGFNLYRRHKSERRIHVSELFLYQSGFNKSASSSPAETLPVSELFLYQSGFNTKYQRHNNNNNKVSELFLYQSGFNSIYYGYSIAHNHSVRAFPLSERFQRCYTHRIPERLIPCVRAFPLSERFQQNNQNNDPLPHRQVSEFFLYQSGFNNKLLLDGKVHGGRCPSFSFIRAVSTMPLRFHILFDCVQVSELFLYQSGFNNRPCLWIKR